MPTVRGRGPRAIPGPSASSRCTPALQETPCAPLQRAPRSRRLSLPLVPLLGSEPPLSAVTLSRPQAGVSASALARRSLGSRSDPGKCQIMPLCCSGACRGFSLYSLAPGRGAPPPPPRTCWNVSRRRPLGCSLVPAPAALMPTSDPLGFTFVHGAIVLAQVTRLCLLLIAGPPAPQLRSSFSRRSASVPGRQKCT